MSVLPADGTPAGGQPGSPAGLVRYGRMLISPFTFYRGAALIVAADLAATPVTGITVQSCGDAHVDSGRLASRTGG